MGDDDDDGATITDTNPESDIHHDEWLVPDKSSQLAAIATEVFEETESLTQLTMRKPRADALTNREAIIGNLVANLAVLSLTHAPGTRVAISARNDTKTRYDRPKFSTKLVTRCIAAMQTIGALERTAGERHAFRTTIAPTQSLLARFVSASIVLGDISRATGAETIILRARTRDRDRKVFIDYDGRNGAAPQGDGGINEWLNVAEVTVSGEPQLPLHLTRRFQIGAADAPHAFDQHGRIYGGFWINMERRERHRLRIAGECLADLDFTGMFAQLAYLGAGLPLPNSDPYEGVEGLEVDPKASLEENERKRRAVKMGLSALFFRTGDMQRLPSKMKRLLGSGWDAKRFRAAIAKRHPGIAHLFGTDLGIRLMFTESRILVATLLDLIGQGVPALPIHDGIMVPISKLREGESAMRRASWGTIGVMLPIKAKDIGAVKASESSLP